MTAEHSLLIETLREIIKLLSEKSLAPLIKSKDLEATVEDFCNLVKAYSALQGPNALGEGTEDTLEETLQSINQHLATFSKYNLIELKKLDFVDNIKPRP
tara:strand:- start:105 stop:404 length:300 start_codon:yes stop_codon:yes gene_type:complete